MIDELTIHIYPTEDDGLGYKYDIYKGDPFDAAAAIDNGQDAYDGGHCTGSLKSAILMAAHTAQEVINPKN